MPDTFCVHCGNTVPQGSAFCPSCGQKAVAAPAAATPAAAVSPAVTPTVVTPPVTSYPQGQLYVPPPTNGQATAGFVLSLVGLFLSFLVIPVVLAVVFSAIGISRASQIEMETGQAKGKGLAIAGLIISIISAFGLFVWFLV